MALIPKNKSRYTLGNASVRWNRIFAGVVPGGSLTSKPEINIKGLKQDVKLNINKMKELYDSTIPNLMEI